MAGIYRIDPTNVRACCRQAVTIRSIEKLNLCSHGVESQMQAVAVHIIILLVFLLLRGGVVVGVSCCPAAVVVGVLSLCYATTAVPQRLHDS